MTRIFSGDLTASAGGTAVSGTATRLLNITDDGSELPLVSVKSEPSGASAQSVADLEAVGPNFNAGTAVIKLTSDDDDCYLIVGNDSSDDVITVDRSGNIITSGDVQLTDGGSVTTTANGDITLAPNGAGTVKSSSDVELTSGGSITTTSNGDITLAPDGAGTVKASSNVELTSGGSITTTSDGDITLAPNGTGKVKFSSDVELTSGGSITSTSNGDVTILPNGSGITIIGDAGSTSHSLDSNDDLFVTGELEVDGSAYLDGDITIAGSAVTVSQYIADEIFLPIEWGEDDQTSAPATAEVLDFNHTSISVRKFDKTTDEFVHFTLAFPDSMVAASGITYRVHSIYSEAEVAGEGVCYCLSGMSLGSGDSLNNPYGVPVNNLVAPTIGQYSMHVSDWSSAVTVSGVGAGEMAKLKFGRDTDNGDDYSYDISVVGVGIRYIKDIGMGV